MLNRRIIAALLTVCSLLPFAGCDSSKADRLIFALEAAQGLPALLGVKGEQAQVVADGFAAVASAARNFRDGRSTWAAFVATFDEVRARPTWQRLDPSLRSKVDAVWTIAARIVTSLKPPPGVVVKELTASDLKRVSEADLQELEKAVGRRK